ncbi:MAG: type II toxin-antitoxin system HicA family toxin [Candidatus Omnitrophota bacterium]|jgi:predicted RNA binding protein YcfA (HicA-like mRNA interferase family)|nr:MAG: type II toxin-antitoxin system HicA family toxin [Candidatus Omnitrophota bacterium]
MKLPRNLSGNELANRLVRFGYRITRQTGSHMRLTTEKNGEHHLTIPDHSPLRIGTVSSIINDVATHLGFSRDEIMFRLFGNR